MDESSRNKQFSIQQKISEFLSDIEPQKSTCEVTIKSLQNLIYELVDEHEQELRIDFLDRSSTKLFERFKGLLTRPQEIQIKLWLGSQYELLGAYQKALKCYQDVIDLCSNEEFYREKAEALRWSGHILARKNQWKEASIFLNKSLDICISHEDLEGESRARNVLGLVNFEQSEFETARVHWQKALEYSESVENNYATATYCNNLGILYTVKGELQRALAYYNESLPRFEKIGHSRNLAHTFHNMAMTCVDLGRIADAGHYFEKSYNLAKEIGDIHLQANVKLNRSRLYLEINDLMLVNVLCHQALSIFRKLGDHLGESDVFRYMGILHTRQKQWKRAYLYLSDSLNMAKKYSSPLNEAETYFEFAHYYREKNEKDQALKYYNQAKELFTLINLDYKADQVDKELSEY
mgnify:CR=1 FL=1